MQVHACLLALRTGRPVQDGLQPRGVLPRPRPPPPGAACATSTAPTATAGCVNVKARIVLDGGAYASSSPAVVLQRGVASPRARTRCPNVDVDALRRLHQQPAVRGDARLRRGAGVLRPRGADGQARRRAAASIRSRSGCATRCATGDRLLTGQAVDCAGAGRRAAASASRDHAAAARAARRPATCAALPGGAGHTTHGEGVVRGVGYAVGFKNVVFSEGFDDYSTARVRLELAGGEPRRRGAHRGGRGRPGRSSRSQAQIARTELGRRAGRASLPADTPVGSAGSTSASRQTWMTGGAVKRVRRASACCAAAALGAPAASAERAGVAGGEVGRRVAGATGPIEETVEYQPPAHRAARPRRPGRRPRAVRLRRPPRGRRRRHRARPGEGGRDRHRAGRRQGAQPAGGGRPDRGRHRPGPGPGGDGGDPGRPTARVRNPSFTDYLIPTDPRHAAGAARRARARRPDTPVRPAAASASRRRSRSTAAVVAAIRAATGRAAARACPSARTIWSACEPRAPASPSRGATPSPTS